MVSATKGHYAVVRAVVEGLKLADPGTRTEVQGLEFGSERTADILSEAAQLGQKTASDVTVASVLAVGSGEDALEIDAWGN